MRTICSYCRKEGEPKPPFDDDHVSHTMCKECFEGYSYQWKDHPLDEFLNGFDGPVLVIDAETRVAGMNQHAEEALGKVQREVIGLLGGEAMECVNARMPGGCGHTHHCAFCTIRNTIQKTMETGEPMKQVPAFLSQANQTLSLVISTELRNDLVVVVVEEMEAAVDSDEQDFGTCQSA